MTKLIILDDEALPASQSYCSCVANCSSRTTWKSSSYKDLSNPELDIFLPTGFFQLTSGEYILFDLSISHLAMSGDMSLNDQSHLCMYFI